MKKYLFILSSLILSFSLSGQTPAKYLAGAVPEIDGRVRFHKVINVNSGLDAKSLYSLMDKWAKENYDSNGELMNRVLLSNAQSYDIACQGETYLIFQRSALVLDRAKMSYQLILEIEDGKCDVSIRNIKYDYSDEKEQVTAEKMITDNIALNKSGDKLNRYYDKFRTYTIDSVNSIINRIDVYLNGINTQGVASLPTRTEVVVQQQTAPAAATQNIPVSTNNTVVETPPAPVYDVMPPQQIARPLHETGTTGMAGYRQVDAEKIPGNIIKLLSDATLITSGTADQVNVMTASWGGLGRFWEKPVTFCFLNPTRYSVQTMDKGDTYTISFYTEAYRDAVMYCGSVSGRNTDKIKGSGLTPIKTPSGATAFAEAWMIFECKKIVAQPISPDAVVEKNLPDDWTKNGFHKMYIGEILNVWVK